MMFFLKAKVMPTETPDDGPGAMSPEEAEGSTNIFCVRTWNGRQFEARWKS